ncbi:hypothetical protein ACQSSU_23375 [Micromonospora echinospora]
MERRGSLLDDGLAHLVGSLTDRHGMTAEQVCDPPARPLPGQRRGRRRPGGAAGSAGTDRGGPGRRDEGKERHRLPPLTYGAPATPVVAGVLPARRAGIHPV